MERETLYRLLELDKKIETVENIKAVVSDGSCSIPITLKRENMRNCTRFHVEACESWGSMILPEEATIKIAKLMEECINIELLKLKREFDRLG